VDDQRFTLNAPSVIGEAIDGEVMIINLVSGTYYNLRGTGAAAWPLLAAGLPVKSIVDSMAAACDVGRDRITREFTAFVDQLLAESIIRAADPSTGPAVVALPAGEATYTGFDLERFDDMRALLVVDPVHEVGDFGWPPQPKSPPTPQ
jgi:hypothetical protein